MINLKNINYFNGNTSDLRDGLTQIVKFMELDGLNSLLISPLNKYISDINCIQLQQSIDNYITYSTFEEFEEILDNKSNIFRVDLLIFDLYYESKVLIDSYIDIIKKLNIKHILIICNEYYYKKSDCINDFTIIREYDNVKSKYVTYLTDNINKWTSSIESLKISYIRDKKIDIIIDKSNTIF